MLQGLASESPELGVRCLLPLTPTRPNQTEPWTYSRRWRPLCAKSCQAQGDRADPACWPALPSGHPRSKASATSHKRCATRPQSVPDFQSKQLSQGAEVV